MSKRLHWEDSGRDLNWEQLDLPPFVSLSQLCWIKSNKLSLVAFFSESSMHSSVHSDYDRVMPQGGLNNLGKIQLPSQDHPHLP